MPYFDHLNRLGEVFIGVAGYDKDGNILFATRSINTCLENDKSAIGEKCKAWLRVQKTPSDFAKRSDTATISLIVRLYTAHKALEMAKIFVEKSNINVPEFIKKRKTENESMPSKTCEHTNIPPPKYPNAPGRERGYNEVCISGDMGDLKNKISCAAVQECERSDDNTHVIPKIEEWAN